MRKWHRHDSRRQVEGVSIRTTRGVSSAGRQGGRFFASVAQIGGGIVALAFLATSWWQRLPIRGISVEGVRLFDTAAILALVSAEQLRGHPSLDVWRTALLRHPFIEAASVYWSAPGYLRIVVRERKLVAVMLRQGQRVGVDAEGRLWSLPDRGVLPQDIPQLEVEGLSAEQARSVAHLMRFIPCDSIAAVGWDTSGGWYLRLRDGSVALVGDTSAMASKWNRWRQFRRVVTSVAPLSVDLRWQGLVVLRASVQQVSSSWPW